MFFFHDFAYKGIAAIGKKEKLMAQHTVGRTDAFRSSVSPSIHSHSVLILRLTCGLVALLGALISFFGTSWDIQWHVLLGRDRTLILPHEMMLAGIAIDGVVALAVIVTETIWSRRYRGIAQQAPLFAGLFAGPLGAYIVGYAALNAAFAFPLDTYWHTLYGIDVSIWAPFHIMIISGMALMAFGAVYMLASAAHLAMHLHKRNAERSAYAGMIGAFAASLSLFTLLVAEGIGLENSVSLGFVSFNLFPILSTLLLGCMLGGAVYALPGKWVATSIVGVSLFFVFIDQVAIPPALNWLMQIEQLTYRAGHTHPLPIALVAVKWPLLSLVSAFLIDLCMQRARQRGWSERLLFIGIALAAFVGGVPLDLASPRAALNLVDELGVLGTLLSIAIGCLGCVIGTTLGRNIGSTTRALES